MNLEEEKKLIKKVEDLELERILNIVHFTNIDSWIEIMDKRWNGRVKKRDLTSLYKWIKHIYAKLDGLKTKLNILKTRPSSPLYDFYEERRKKLERGLIECAKCFNWIERGIECPICTEIDKIKEVDEHENSNSK